MPVDKPASVKQKPKHRHFRGFVPSRCAAQPMRYGEKFYEDKVSNRKAGEVGLGVRGFCFGHSKWNFRDSPTVVLCFVIIQKRAKRPLLIKRCLGVEGDSVMPVVYYNRLKKGPYMGTIQKAIHKNNSEITCLYRKSTHILKWSTAVILASSIKSEIMKKEKKTPHIPSAITPPQPYLTANMECSASSLALVLLYTFYSSLG